MGCLQKFNYIFLKEKLQRIREEDKAVGFSSFFSPLPFSFCNNNKAKDLVKKKSG